jgi:small subunit ribosomal protein S20
MPITNSARKRLRSSLKRRTLNRARKSRIKTSEARLDELVQAGQREQAVAALTRCFSELDKAAKKGTIHPNKANRKKSRLAARVARLPKAQAPS